MPMGRDYRKLPYSPKSGKRSLAVCGAMVVAGLAAFGPPISELIDRSFTIFGHRVNTAAFVPQCLIFLGIVNVVPAVMRLTPPSKR
jgi:hypothetical protein